MRKITDGLNKGVLIELVHTLLEAREVSSSVIKEQAETTDMLASRFTVHDIPNESALNVN